MVLMPTPPARICDCANSSLLAAPADLPAALLLLPVTSPGALDCPSLARLPDPPADPLPACSAAISALSTLERTNTVKERACEPEWTLGVPAQSPVLPADSRETALRRQFEALTAQHRPGAYRLALRLLGNRCEAEDATQEALARAWWHFPNFDSSRPFEVWLLRIVRNLCIDMHRRRKHRMTLSLDTPISGDHDPSWLHNLLADPAADPQTQVLADQIDERLQRALDDLTPEHRHALLLVTVQQCSYEHAAELLGCALGTVRSRVHRARRSLRRALAA